MPVALVLLGCTDGDDARVAETRTTTEATTTTTSVPYAGCDRLPPPTAEDGGEARVLGRADVVGSAYEEVFAHVGSGASVALVGVFAVDDCTAAELGTFPIGGTVTHLDGLRCVDGDLLALSAESADGRTYVGREVQLELRDGRLVAGATADRMMSADDPELAGFASLTCPGVDPP